MTMTEPREERRSGSVEPIKVGVYSPGIARVEKYVAKRYAEHDVERSTEDRERYDILYALLNHCTKVAAICEQVARKLDLTDSEVQQTRAGGFCHDWGKLNQACSEYRENRTWNEEERSAFTQKHQRIGQEDVMGLAPMVREQDHLALTFISIIAGNHHDWDRIQVADLRLKCMIVGLSDSLETKMEDRQYKPGQSQFEAVENLELDIFKMQQSRRYAPYAEELQRVLTAITDLYGPNSVIPIR